MADSDNDLPVIDLAATEGYIVDDTDEDDPVLLAPDGTPINTWRKNYFIPTKHIKFSSTSDVINSSCASL